MMNAPETLFAGSSDKTDTTGGTDSISNETFLKMVFRDAHPTARPLLVSFTGNPATATSSAWAGKAWHIDTDLALQIPPSANNYFSLADFLPDDAGCYRRRKSSFRALHAVMLDDIGSKVVPDRLTLAPSWMLETSPGNFQAGYLLDQPLEDSQIGDSLMKAIIGAGLCDPGAGGPCARLARLPVAHNGKYQPAFACRLASWAPNLRYSVSDLVEGLQLELKIKGRPARGHGRAAQALPSECDAVWLPRPDTNPVLTALRDGGLYKRHLGDGRHEITCPWVEEHTDTVDSGTAYFEPDGTWPLGGFKCLHGHCADRHIRNLLDLLEIKPEAARMRPTIRIIPGEMDRIVDAAERELARTGHYYQRGGLLVTVVRDPSLGVARVRDVTLPTLTRALSACATWESFDKRAEDWIRKDPPSRHMSVLHDAANYRHLPVLGGVARHPYLREDGSLMARAGYDPESFMFGDFNAELFSVPETPSKSQAQTALQELNALLDEFVFSADSDKAAALSAILSAVLRPSLTLAPMYLVQAHAIGSGKSYLCELITAFATPQRGTPTSFPADDEECRKLLLAELLSAPAVIEFDNLTSDLVAHKSLCTALTSEFLSGRILGQTKTATVSTRTLMLASGNNVSPIQDMARRVITIRLNPLCETPAARSFQRPHLVREVLEHRGHLVSAALTIVRAWIVAGRPQLPCRPLASFGMWSDLCRQPLMWLGCPDPTGEVYKAMAEDPERKLLGELLRAWSGVFGRRAVMVREAIKEADGNSEASLMLRYVLEDIAGDRQAINPRRLGWWLKRHLGRFVDGRCLQRGKASRSSETWQVEVIHESVSPVSSVSPCEEAESGGDEATAAFLAEEEGA